MNTNDRHIELIHQLFSAADQINLPLWLQGGWAIDAKLNRITREHEDIDIAYPGDRTTEFLALLHSLGGVITEQTSYGFLAEMQGILLDCEPCICVGEGYELEGLPPGTCHPNLQEVLAVNYFVAPVGKQFSGIIFTTSKKFHRVSGDPKIFRVLRSPEDSLVKLKHKTYTNNLNIFLLHPLTLTLREVPTIDSFTV